MNLQKILIEYIEKQKKVQKKFSLAQLSEFTGVSKTSLSEYLNGNRKLTSINKIKIASAIIQNKKTLNKFLKDTEKPSEYSKSREKVLKKIQFSHISDWEYFAILTLSHLKNSSSDPNWISQTLSIPVERVVECLDKLRQLKLIKIQNLKIIRQNFNLVTTRGISNQDIKKNHSQSINLADELLYEVPVDRREYLTSNISINEKDINHFRQDIIKFRKKMAKKYTRHENADHLYKLNIQFFPISKTFK